MDPSQAMLLASGGSGARQQQHLPHLQPQLLPPQMPAHYHWLLHLPPAFWARMHHYLDYGEILNLSLLNSQFRDVQVEEYLSWTVRYAIVAHQDREAAALFSRKDQSQTCACYLCFRMKPINDFQRPTDTYTCARVTQRDPYSGRRQFEPVTDPSPAEMGSIVHPPSTSSSPSGMGGGMRGMVLGTGPLEHLPALNIRTAHGPMVAVSRTMWMPQAPGAEVGQIEQLRRYCISCALETHLLVPADVTTTQTGKRLWVCRCRQVRPETTRRCDACQMNQVFRD